jgi:hypothetical protein
MRAVLLLACVACGDDLPPFEPGDEVPNDIDLYADDRIWDVAIELDAGDIAALEADPFSYVAADVTVGGLALPDSGVRLKGTFSFRPLSGKAAFKIRTDWRRPGQSIGKVHRLTLNNMWQSRGVVSEWLGYRVFAAAGVPAPRCGFARVWVNGELYGLYANVETEDEHFLARHFDDATGNLYEAELTDLSLEEIGDFEQEQGEDTSRADLAELAAAVAAAGDDLFFAEPPLIDTDEFLAFVAAEAAIGHWDGYWKAHNYRLYHDLAGDQWSFLPWGIDQSYERRLDPFAGAGLVTVKCMGSARCLARYAAVARGVVAEIERLDLPAQLDAVTALIDESLDRDPKKPYGAEKIRRHQAAIRDRLVSEPVWLRERLACADEAGERDDDGDGAGACLADCDDSSEAARPGQGEVCDGLDNDCNGWVDDLAGCGCESQEVGTETFHFCRNPMSWTAARTHCAGIGAELAWFADAEEARQVFAVAVARVRDHWYFALNDRVEEDSWRAPDDPIDFTDWASDEPDSFGDEDCAVLDRHAGGAWSDVRCGEPHPFVCR